MLKQVTFWGATALALSLPLGAAAQDADTVVVTVGDTEITLGELIIIRARLPQQYEQFPDDVLFEGIIDQVVQQQLLADAVDDVPDRVELSLKNERRSMLAGEAITELAADAITEDAIAEEYASRVGTMEAGVEWNASHLLVETEEEALEAKTRVDGGEDFADVARDVSTGPSGPNGGNLGWFGTGQMVAEFETAVSEMDPGDVSEPVQTQFGWHIVALNDTRQQALPGLEDMRNDIVNDLREKLISDRIAELEAATEVTRPEEGAFDPAILKNLELLEP